MHDKVSSSKSSFYSALLGKMVKSNGIVYAGESVAYCSQQPWAKNLTIRDNISFDKPYKKRKYNKVPDASGLVVDWPRWPRAT